MHLAVAPACGLIAGMQAAVSLRYGAWRSIAGRPLLGLWLQMLSEAGFSEIVVNLHHHADLVSEYIRRSPWAERVILAPLRMGGCGGGDDRSGRRFGGRLLPPCRRR